MMGGSTVTTENRPVVGMMSDKTLVPGILEITFVRPNG